MKNMLELLIRSLDHELTGEEQNKLNAALSASPELRAEQQQYIKMRKLFGELPINSAPGFSDSVVQKWKTVKTKNKFSVRVVHLFPRVAAAAILLLLVAWSVIYFNGENITAGSIIGIENVSPDEAFSLMDF